MPFIPKSFTEIFQDISSELEVQSSQLTDLNPGSRLHALIRSFTSTIAAAWDGLSQLRSLFFVSTSSGADLDRRVADYGMQRKPGSYASGNLVARPTSGTLTVNIGDTVSSADGLLVFDIMATTEITAPFTLVPVVSSEIGNRYNLAAGTKIFPLTDINVTYEVGTNGLDLGGKAVGSFSGGTDEESDDDVKVRFTSYLKSLSRGTRLAIQQALDSINGIGNVIIEEAVPVPGWITLTIADTSGELPDVLRDEVDAVMNNWAAAGMGYLIQPITRTDFNIEVTVFTTDTALDSATLEADVTAQLVAAFEDTEVGQSVYQSQISKAAHVSGIRNVVITTPSSDIIASPGQLLGLQGVQVTVVYAQN